MIRRRAPSFRANSHVRQEGYVTAEAALVLPTLVFMLAFALWGISAVTAELECVDASRAAVRELARGESEARAVAVAQGIGPRGAHVAVGRSAGLVTVKVSVTTRPLGMSWSGVELSASASAVPEQP